MDVLLMTIRRFEGLLGALILCFSSPPSHSRLSAHSLLPEAPVHPLTSCLPHQPVLCINASSAWASSSLAIRYRSLQFQFPRRRRPAGVYIVRTLSLLVPYPPLTRLQVSGTLLSIPSVVTFSFTVTPRPTMIPTSSFG